MARLGKALLYLVAGGAAVVLFAAGSLLATRREPGPAPESATLLLQGVAYPEGYREWAHVKSMVIQEGHPLYDAFGGVHHIYANGPAVRVLQDGKRASFPDGSVIVFDLLNAQQGDGAIVEGERKFIGVMRKDGSRYSETGGWGFAAFAGSTRNPVAIEPKACFGCHQGAAATDYVFAEWRR